MTIQDTSTDTFLWGKNYTYVSLTHIYPIFLAYPERKTSFFTFIINESSDIERKFTLSYSSTSMTANNSVLSL